MKKILIIASVALLCASCLDKGSNYQTTYTAGIYFNMNWDAVELADSVRLDWGMSDANSMLLFNNSYNKETKAFEGGFCYSVKRDTGLEVAQTNKYPNFTSCAKSLRMDLEYPGRFVDGYMVYHEGPKMPEKQIYFWGSTAKGTCTCSPKSLCITNIQPNKVRFVSIGEDGKLTTNVQNNEYLRLTITGYLGGEQTGVVNYTLVDKSKVNIDWDRVSLDALGKVDEMKFKLEGSADVPLYCCIDQMVVDIFIKQ